MKDYKYEPTITVQPIRDGAQLARVMEAAQSDDHLCLAPTHFIVKFDEVVGYYNTGFCVHWWMHSKKCDRDDSRQALAVLDALQAQAGLGRYILLCAQSSPYRDHLVDKYGCQDLGTTGLFLRTNHVLL